jgi:hypothetical protein
MRKQSGWAAGLMAGVLMAQAGLAAAKAQDAAADVKREDVKRQIVVSLEDRKLALVENGRAVKVYPVAVGKPSTPSPEGTFTIERRVTDPVYQHDGKTIPPGPGNPVGTRWMGLSVKGYGIHGTNEPKSIGKAASHGCIRMARADLEDLYSQVQVGDTVELIGHRDEETAELFGNGLKPAAPAPALAEKSAPTITETSGNKSEPAVPVSAAVTGANAPTLQSRVAAVAAAILTGAL